MIVIIDYNMGNLGSILNMLKKIGEPGKISSESAEILAAEKLILPGVGSFDQGMANLNHLGLIPVLTEMVVHRRAPILGICLGMQLMTHSSEEGRSAGLGWIDAATVRFRHEPGLGLKIPHMGWNHVDPHKERSLYAGMHADPRFYFVHSYHVICEEPEDVLSTTTYGYEFTSAFQRGNIVGVQFHPEKSHKFGMELMKNFAEAELC